MGIDGLIAASAVELRHNGALDLAAPLLAEESGRPLNVTVATERTDAGDRFLRHKTTRRRFYESAFAAATGQEAAKDAGRAGKTWRSVPSPC